MADVKHWLYDTIDLLPLQKLVLVYEVFFGLLGSHLDLPQHIIMTVPCRLIPSLEAAINKKTYSYMQKF